MEIEAIHNQFHKTLYSYILTRVRSAEDASDILQEVFIKISLKINSLADGERLKSWIFAIVRNTIIDYYRKSANNRSTALTDQVINDAIDENDEDATQGLDKCLKGFIQQLPEEYRLIIIDSEIKGIKQKDLIKKYNLAYSSVRSRVQRGRARLKEMLTRCCKIETDTRGNILESTPKDSCNNSCGDCD